MFENKTLKKIVCLQIKKIFVEVYFKGDGGSDQSRSNEQHAASERAAILAKPSTDIWLDNNEKDQLQL